MVKRASLHQICVSAYIAFASLITTWQDAGSGEIPSQEARSDITTVKHTHWRELTVQACPRPCPVLKLVQIFLIHLPSRRISDWLVLLSLSRWWWKCHTSLDRAHSKRLSTEDSAVEIYSHKALSRPRGCLLIFSLKLKDMGNLRDDTLHRKSTKIPCFFHHLNFKNSRISERRQKWATVRSSTFRCLHFKECCRFLILWCGSTATCENRIYE